MKMRMIKTAIIVLLWSVFGPHSLAQSPELAVGELNVPPLNWGKQAVVFDVTNNVNNVKYLTVEAKVQFSGSIFNPSHRSTTNYLLKPLESRTFNFELYIPTSFGQADVMISFYDVVDTLDVLLPDHVFLTQPLAITFEIPSQLRSHLGDRIAELSAQSPRIGRDPDLSNEFTCALLILLDEGKTIDEIAELAEVDRDFILETLQVLTKKGHLVNRDGSYHATFPVRHAPVDGPEILVGVIDFSSLRWGWQTASFEVTNNGSDLKFLAIELEVQFAGSYLNPNRRTRTYCILQPLESKTLTPAIYIPGNYGTTQLTVALYDVVDTLDLLLPTQRFFQQPFSIKFGIPDEMLPYVNEKITMPPRAEHHPDFDNEFSRALLFLLNEGKSAAEIAAMAVAESSFVNETIRNLADKDYLTKTNDGYRTAFPIISVKEAEDAKALAVLFADTLAALIKKNMSLYAKVLDSLIAASAVDKDSNAFFDGGAVLYRPYPVVSALLLWFELGQRFIVPSAPLRIYDGTDLCNAHIPQYMYAVQGGDAFNGTHFYDQSSGDGDLEILYGDVVPVIECPEDYVLKAQLMEKVEWQYGRQFLPESFMLDTSVVRPVLEALARGTNGLLRDAHDKLQDVSLRHGHENIMNGESYWFWNLVATRVVRKLVDMGVVSRQGNGQFRLSALPK